MALTPGARLGHYEIAEQIGAGGMGEVYRAIDTNLKRAVAIKVLPDAVAADAERLARLQREAEVLASLNHPHIAQIYGLEKSERSTALVLELVEGLTLADRIAAGPLPLEEALPIARQIAEALETAHEQGIIHRDLKPANIKLRPDGQVKVLDFGLAKLASGELAPSGAAALTASPTLTVHATMLGVILGTATYMSPEQAKGKTVDRRSDIWAFGVVLCEMLTGRRMYDAETAAETLARIIEREPDLSALPSTTPPAVRTVLERCLTKDPRARLQAIGEARILLERTIAHPESAPLAVDSVQRRSRVVLPWALAGALGVTVIAMLFAWGPWRIGPVPSSKQVYGQVGADASLMTDIGTAAVLSPDGELLVFTAQNAVDQPSRLYVRRLIQLQATPLSGTDDARSPFFSPDGQWIAFFAEGKLKKVAVTGGPVSTLTDAPSGRGGSWAEDNTITFQPEISAVTNSLARVSSEGGKADLFSPETRGRPRFPQVLAGGAGVLYTRSGTGDGSAELVIERSSGERKIVLKGTYGRYLPSGHLVYLQESTLFAAAFDIEQLEVIGRPVPVIEGVMAAPRGTNGAQFAVSETGTLVYVPEPATANEQPIMWMDSSGTFTPLLAQPTNWSNPRFSPDGRQLAFEIIDGSAKISIYDVVRGTLDPLTFERDTRDTGPFWTPDGQRVTFLSNRDNATVRNLYWKRADNTGSVQRLTVSDFEQYSGSWHPSGKALASGQSSRSTNPDIWILPMEGDEKSGWKPGTPKEFVNTIANEGYPMFSPDGRWLAYTSNETRIVEVYVTSYPGRGGPWKVSSGGGRSPIWSRTKPELFFTTGNGQIMVSSYRADGDSFQRDQPRLWSEKRFLQRPGSDDRTLDLHPNGTRFAVAADTDSQVAVKKDKIVFVFNFFDELRRRVPVR